MYLLCRASYIVCKEQTYLLRLKFRHSFFAYSSIAEQVIVLQKHGKDAMYFARGVSVSLLHVLSSFGGASHGTVVAVISQ